MDETVEFEDFPNPEVITVAPAAVIYFRASA
jgi:hypothetical protein